MSDGSGAAKGNGNGSGAARGTLDGRTAAGENENENGNERLKRWFLLTGNRFAVAAAMLAGVAGLFAVAGLLGLATVTSPNRVMWYLNGTVNGLLTLVPIAVGVNQIVLAHEFGSVKDLYDRRKDITQFRERVEWRTDTQVSSPRAFEFFESLLDGVSETASAFARETERSGRFDDEMERYVASVTAEADATRRRLSEREPGLLDTLLIVLDYDDTIQTFETRRLLAERDAALPREAKAELAEIEELFAQFDTARQYLKTVVVERQLARLSRLLVYTGIPAVAVAALGIFTYRDLAGLVLPHAALVAVAATLIAVSLVPLAILSAYILRVATIARQTAAFGPFVSESKLPNDDGEREDFE